MDLWKGYELSRTYVPAAYYTITSIKSKNGRANPLHDEVLGRKAYVVYLEVGERGFIKYLPDYDDRYHCLHTSTVLEFTPWGNGEDTITIQTANTEYIKKVYLGRYAVKEEAILARLTKEVELYKEFSPQRGLLESLNL